VLVNFFLVDDDRDDRDLFLEALTDINTSITLQSSINGKEALQTLIQHDIGPEMIFLDINMPEMNGWECLSHIKTIEKLRHIPVLMFSTSSVNVNGKKALEHGAVAYLEKPTNYLKLRAFLERLINEASPDNLIDTLRVIELTKTVNLLVV